MTASAVALTSARSAMLASTPAAMYSTPIQATGRIITRKVPPDPR